MYIVNDITARNAIPAGDRTAGDVVFVTSLGEHFVLVGGILDANWEPCAYQSNAKTVSFDAEYANGNSTATFTWALANGQNQSVTLNDAAVALTINPAGVGVGTFKLKVTQAAGGSMAIASGAISGGTVYTPDGTSGVTLSAGAGDVDFIWGHYDGTNFYMGVGALDMVAFV